MVTKKFEQIQVEFTDLVNQGYSEQVKGRLKEKLPQVQSLEKFLTEHHASKEKSPEIESEDQTLLKLDHLLGKVLALDALPDYKSIQNQAAEIRQEGDRGRRRMLYEDLVIACDQKIKHLKKLEDWQQEIVKLMELVSSIELEESDVLKIELENLQRAGSPVKLDNFHKRSLDLLEKQQGAVYREERRVAVLKALESMGYEIQDGMQTGKVQGGRLIFQKHPESEYALEVVSSEGKEIVQTRIIRFGDEASSASELQKRKDIEVEEDWCEDHAELLEKLCNEGYQVAFRLKRKPGELDVKVVSPPRWWEERQKKLREKKRIRETSSPKGQLRQQ